jgi:hypothetical protein
MPCSPMGFTLRTCTGHPRRGQPQHSQPEGKGGGAKRERGRKVGQSQEAFAHPGHDRAQREAEEAAALTISWILLGGLRYCFQRAKKESAVTATGARNLESTTGSRSAAATGCVPVW